MGMDSGRLETVPPGTVNLDTVRALHQTVVSLRTALEVSKNELKELKEKYQKHSDCISYADVIEKLTIENHILRRRIIDTDFETTPAQNIKLQVTYSPKPDDLSSDVFIQTATTDAKSPVLSTRSTKDKSQQEELLIEDENRSIGEELQVDDQVISSRTDKSEQIEEGHVFCDTADSFIETDKEQSSEDNVSPEHSPSNGKEESPNENLSVILSPQSCEEKSQEFDITEFDQLNDHGTFKAKLEFLSKFDVKIKVRTLNEDSALTSTTSDSESVYGDRKEKEFEKKSKDKTFGKEIHHIFQSHNKDCEEKLGNKNEKDTETNINFVGKEEHFQSKKNQYFQENPKDQPKINFGGKRKHFEAPNNFKGNKVNIRTVSSENIKMAVSNEGDTKVKVDNFDIQVKITSEENLSVKETKETCRRKDALNLDIDNLSFRSISEGDNSVFSEQVVTPQDQDQAAALPSEQENSDESEVDDIELIFTTDESKHMSHFQEDLVSIRDSESWTPQPSVSAHSTPVLIKFHTLDSDFTSGDKDDQENASKPIADSLKTKRVSLPSDKDIIRHVAFTGSGLDLPGRGILKSCDNKSDNMLFRRSPSTSSKKLSSVDSLTCEFNKGLSFDNTKSSSFELGSSMDMIHREESDDSFHRLTHLGHRFSVFAETDISKCGISEEDLASNMYLRRNTCPNPFQYRTAVKPSLRPPGPLKVPVGSGPRLRPILRDGLAPRTDSGAQTDVTALPPRWGSDGYLAYPKQGPVLALPPACPPRRPAPRLPAPPPQRDDGRRVLLSDIGFTSMVPELSRSWDPLCALARRLPPDSDTSASISSTAKYVSRGSHRSPSMDRSCEWTPQTLPLPGITESVSWRASLPDVRSRSRSPETARLLKEADCFLRRSADSLRDDTAMSVESVCPPLGQPYIPREPKQLRLGHAVKVITPQGRVAVGRVRYVGIAGATAAKSSVVVGAEFPLGHGAGLTRNDGTHNGRRYFLAAPHYTALFVPFNKVVMAWAH